MKKDTPITAEFKPIEIEKFKATMATICIQGDSDLILNCMNARTVRELAGARDPSATKKVIKQEPNEWEDIITAVHWLNGYQMKDTYLESSEEKLNELLQNNAPCITSFGLMKSFCTAVTSNGIDKYSVKFRNSINILDHGGLIPVKFTEHHIDKKLMSPQRGRPVLSIQNRFSGWSAEITVKITGRVYDLSAVTTIVNLAGFGAGIGSGRSSGFGRYHVTQVFDLGEVE